MVAAVSIPSRPAYLNFNKTSSFVRSVKHLRRIVHVHQQSRQQSSPSPTCYCQLHNPFHIASYSSFSHTAHSAHVATQCRTKQSIQRPSHLRTRILLTDYPPTESADLTVSHETGSNRCHRTSKHLTNSATPSKQLDTQSKTLRSRELHSAKAPPPASIAIIRLSHSVTPRLTSVSPPPASPIPSKGSTPNLTASSRTTPRQPLRLLPGVTHYH